METMGSTPTNQLVLGGRRSRSRFAALRVQTPAVPRWPSRTGTSFA
jgi:hypothetical protein